MGVYTLCVHSKWAPGNSLPSFAEFAGLPMASERYAPLIVLLVL